MNIQAILFLCGILTITALPQKSPFFEIRNGRLVPVGKEPSSLGSRIVGGEDAEPNSAPFMVSLQWGIVRPSHFCGGTIIRPNWVLTGKNSVSC